MTLKTHYYTGFAFGCFLSGLYIQGIVQTGLFSESDPYHILMAFTILFGVLAGSLYPEIDRRNSGLFSDTPSMWENSLGRKGLTHTIFPGALFSGLPFGLLYLILSLVTGWDAKFFLYLGVSFIIGNLWHIFQDFLCTGGVMILYPFVKRRLSLKLIKGPVSEKYILRFLVTGILLARAVILWAVI